MCCLFRGRAVLVVATVFGLAAGELGQSRAGDLSRTIQVIVKHTRPMRGMTASSTVKIVGSVRSDSYDSGDPAKSTNGQYDPAKAGDKGFIGTTSKVAGDLEVTGNAQIVGQAGTGAPGVLSVKGSASVGSKRFVDAGLTGIESSGYLQDDMNLTFADVVLPFSPSLLNTPLPGTVNSTVYNYVLDSGNYTMDNLIMGLGQKAVVTGRAALYIRDTFSMSSDASITILPGASLDIYVGKQTTLSGGSIANLNGRAEFLNYYGLPGNTSIYLKGNSAFIGSIYAPQATIEFAGTSDFYGASISRQIVLSGAFQFHYDEALSRKGLAYVPISWREL